VVSPTFGGATTKTIQYYEDLIALKVTSIKPPMVKRVVVVLERVLVLLPHQTINGF